MLYPFLANAVAVIHIVFILFAAFGGLLVFYGRRWAWLHIPAVCWAGLVELTGWICPLTPLENHFRVKAGITAYGTDFMEQYVWPILYPQALTRWHQVLLGTFVILINLAIYAGVFYRLKHRSPQGHS